MGDIRSIEKAIQALAPAELGELRRWFAQFDAEAWDLQLEHDVAAGKLDKLAEEALTDHHSGSSRSL